MRMNQKVAVAPRPMMQAGPRVRRQARVRVSTLGVTLTLLTVCAAAACSDADPGAGNSVDAPFAIEVSQTYITVENRTGGPLVGGQVEIIPVGILPPFTSTLPRLETGGKTEMGLNTFRGSGGPFNRTIARWRSVRITAKDQFGEVYEHEAPFN